MRNEIFAKSKSSGTTVERLSAEAQSLAAANKLASPLYLPQWECTSEQLDEVCLGSCMHHIESKLFDVEAHARVLAHLLDEMAEGLDIFVGPGSMSFGLDEILNGGTWR